MLEPKSEAKKRKAKPRKLKPKPRVVLPAKPAGDIALAHPIAPDMPGPEKKPWYKSRTLWGIAMTAAGAVANALGIDLEFLADGFQLGDITQVVGVVVAVYGRLTAKKTLE